METLILYFVKMLLCSALMFGYYYLVLKDKTFHHYNRFYLLATVFVSLFLPFLKINYFTIEVNPKLFLLLQNLQTSNAITNSTNDGNLYFTILVSVIGLVSFLILSRIILGLIKIQSFKKQFPKTKLEHIAFYETNLENAPFSFFKNLFWKDSILLQSDLGKQILKHEMVHIEQKHSFDKLFMELVTALLWFNPVFWFIKKEISLIHEYLADKKAVKNMDTKAFAQMLLASHFSGKVLPATSPFLSSNLKKRLIMLKKSKTKFAYARKILVLPLLFALAFAYLVNAKNKEIREANRSIESALQVKRDTITPKDIHEAIRIQGDSARFYSEQIRKEDEKVKELNKKIAEKNKEVKALAKEKAGSPEYLKAENDLAELMNEQSKVWNSPEYQKKWKKIEEHFAKMESFFNSPEYEMKLKEMELKGKEMEKKFNSKEFKKQMADAERQSKKTQEFVNSPEFKKHMEDAERQAKKTQEFVNSPEFKKHMRDVKVEIDAAPKVDLPTNKDYYNKPDFSKIKPKYFLDEKEISEDEMKRLDANIIELVNVIKNDKNSQGEIYIKSKKNK